jgi:predicted Zn-dependent protease with MMP-like domain/Flp pilus assembly protein TadD
MRGRGERSSGSGEEDGAVARLLDEAADAFDEGRFDAALARADDALRAGARSIPALHYRAAALAELGRSDEALEAYDRALAVGKGDPELLLGAADFLVNLSGDDDPDRERVERGVDLARRGAKVALKAGDRQLAGELAYVEATGLNQLGRSGEALGRLELAEAELPDSPDVQVEKGFALFELCRFVEARRALERADKLGPDDAWTQHYLGLVAEKQGNEDEARRRFARARKLSPEEFPKGVALSQGAFDEAVEAALASLPETVRRYLSNVAITVEDLPSDDDLVASDPPLSPAILGLFRGAPYGQKASMDPWSHFPSAIVLFQKNLERFARSRADLIEQIGITLIHEVGHFLGLDEDELYERGLD